MIQISTNLYYKLITLKYVILEYSSYKITKSVIESIDKKMLIWLNFEWTLVYVLHVHHKNVKAVLFLKYYKYSDSFSFHEFSHFSSCCDLPDLWPLTLRAPPQSAGELENDEHTAGVMMQMVRTASRFRLPGSAEPPFKRMSGNTHTHTHTHSLLGDDCLTWTDLGSVLFPQWF